MIVTIHDEQLAPHGGSAGLRDHALLESALDRPRNKWAYEQAGLPELAAAYGYGIARNHPFVDGNKPTALLAIYTFLGVNDVDFIVSEADAAAIILALAAGEVSEDSLARWIRDNWPRRDAALQFGRFANRLPVMSGAAQSRPLTEKKGRGSKVARRGEYPNRDARPSGGSRCPILKGTGSRLVPPAMRGSAPMSGGSPRGLPRPD